MVLSVSAVIVAVVAFAIGYRLDPYRRPNIGMMLAEFLLGLLFGVFFLYRLSPAPTQLLSLADSALSVAGLAACALCLGRGVAVFRAFARIEI